MNNQENLSVLIKLRGEGMELIDQLIGDMGKAGAKTGEFRQKADELNGELQRLEQQQGLIESFRKSKERVDEAAGCAWLGGPLSCAASPHGSAAPTCARF